MQTFIVVVIVVGIALFRILQAAAENKSDAARPGTGKPGNKPGADWDDEGWDEWSVGGQSEQPAPSRDDSEMGRPSHLPEPGVGPLAKSSGRPAQTLDEVLRRVSGAAPRPPAPKPPPLAAPPAQPPPLPPQTAAPPPPENPAPAFAPIESPRPQPPPAAPRTALPMPGTQSLEASKIFATAVAERRRKVMRNSLEALKIPRLPLAPPARVGKRRPIPLAAMGKKRLRQALLMREILDQPRAFDI